MPRLTNPTNRQLKGILDRKWSAYTRSLGYCEACGSRTALTDSHIIGRSYLKTRWDPRNKQCLCAPCHGSYEMQPIAFARFVESTDCGKHVDTMVVQANANTKPDYQLWLTLYDLITQINPIEAREWLGDTILLHEMDIAKI